MILFVFWLCLCIGLAAIKPVHRSIDLIVQSPAVDWYAEMNHREEAR
jgi:hypothetical protein